MNLKRLRGIVAVALATIAAAMFAGCSNSLAGSIDESAVGGSNARMVTLSLSATGIPNEYAEQFARSYPNSAKVASRSITPNDSFDIGKIDDDSSQSKGLVFYLSGTSTTGKKLDDTQVKIAKKESSDPVVYEYTKMDGSSVAIDSMSWNLVLTAYKSYTSATTNEPVLRGHCSVDLRNGSGTASFMLSTENLTTVGKVTITGKFYTRDNVASYTMGIYRKDSTSEKVHEASPVTSVTADGEGLASFNYECPTINPGSYLYKMIFKNSAGVITGSFVDTLVVDPGNELNRDIGTLDIINEKPEAPTNFTAELVKDSETSDGTYQVKLSWESGGGETNFEIELTEYTKGEDGNLTAVTGYPKIYGMASMDLGTQKDDVIDFQGSDIWAGKGGAMTYGDTEAYLKLKLGTLYDVRIRARNYVGTSKKSDSEDWTPRTAITDVDKEYGSEKINRMKIAYNLNGGTLKLFNSGVGNYEDKTGIYTEYKTWKGADLSLLEIDILEADTNTNRLKKGDSPFVEWRTDKDDASSGITKADYKNLSVTAFYGSSITGSVGMADAKKDVMLSDIEISYGSTTKKLTDDDANKTHDIKRHDGSEWIKLRIVLKTDTNTYTNIQFALGDDMLPLTPESDVPNACTLELQNYDSGIIQVTVIADTANAKGMSQPLIFRLK